MTTTSPETDVEAGKPLLARDMRLRLPEHQLLTPGELILSIDAGQFADGRLCWIVQEATLINGTRVFIPDGRDTRKTIILLEGIIAALKQQDINPIPVAVNLSLLPGVIGVATT